MKQTPTNVELLLVCYPYWWKKSMKSKSIYVKNQQFEQNTFKDGKISKFSNV